MALEHFDVLVVGAGLSGIGAAVHLQTRCPGRSVAILESRERLGGTWDLFRYPGVRSDSDMYTLGYAFRPWTDPKAIADGPAILRYVQDTAREHGIDRRIRFGHRVVRAAWDTPTARWTLDIERDGDAGPLRLSCGFLLMCSGYYRYDAGHTPDFAGRDTFRGRIVHPQHWTEDIAHAGQRVVVIGSGATAVTLVPALARSATHVTMLQRSPTWMVALPSEDRLANGLRRVLPARIAYAATRWKQVLLQTASFNLCRRRPKLARSLLLRGVRARLGPGHDIERHFTPRYNPWEQRLCLVPDGDFFRAITTGRASVVTDQIEMLSESGVKLRSGATLDADIIVSATGLRLSIGKIELNVNGLRVDPSRTVSYKGLMYSGVPNMANTFGYTNASWTLKADLTSEYVCRLLKHMRKTGARQCLPPAPGPGVRLLPWVDFSSGYFQRAADQLPRQGAVKPWKLNQNYLSDLLTLRYGAINDGVLQFSR